MWRRAKRPLFGLEGRCRTGRRVSACGLKDRVMKRKNIIARSPLSATEKKILERLAKIRKEQARAPEGK